MQKIRTLENQVWLNQILGTSKIFGVNNDDSEIRSFKFIIADSKSRIYNFKIGNYLSYFNISKMIYSFCHWHVSKLRFLARQNLPFWVWHIQFDKYDFRVVISNPKNQDIPKFGSSTKIFFKFVCFAYFGWNKVSLKLAIKKWVKPLKSFLVTKIT